MNVPDNLKYTTSHEWVRDDGDGICTIGITDYAQAELTELVYVELPDSGREVSAAEDVAVVESVKSASDIYSPVAGEITEANQELTNDPSAVNNSPYESGWLFKIRISNPAELDALLSPEAYREHIS
jgi:glycine cleavage system H protein